MSQSKPKRPTIYNPASQTPEEIVSNFVIRLREFKELFEAIKNDRMGKPPQHFIIQGQRGYGKTTLLLRLNLEINDDAELKQWLLPVMFDEEQYGVHTLAKLWEEAIDILEDRYECFSGLSDKIDSLYDTESPEEGIFELLVGALKKEKKKLVLLLDNFGEMIEKFEKKENQRLREVLITCEHIRIIATSSAILEFYYNYREPFYDFFKVITLDELDRDETIALLRKLGETYGADAINRIIELHPERVEALRRLTGGVPRTVVLLYEIFVDNVDGNSFKDLESILDRVTPLYKHRMDDLPVQQQTIVDALAQNWDAMSAGEIARKVRLSSKVVSAQLNQLEKSQLVRKIQTSTKNRLYRISERFFNIYYLMRLGRRKNRNRVLWLVRFFELWCSEEELVERTQKHITALREGRMYQPHAFWISQALSRTRIPEELQHELITRTREYLFVKKSPLYRDLYKSHLEIREEAKGLIERDNLALARKKLLEDGASKGEVDFVIGNVYRTRKKDFAQAIKHYISAASEGDIAAMYNLGLLYETEYKEYEKAEKYYSKAADNGDRYSLNNLGILYSEHYKNYEKAKECFQAAIKSGHATAMFNLAFLYQKEYKDFEQAKKYYLMATEYGEVDAMFNLGLLFENEFEEREEAEKYYLMAAEKGSPDAKNNLAHLFFELKKRKKDALRLQQEAYLTQKDPAYAYGYVMVQLWSNNVDEATKTYPEVPDYVDPLNDLNESTNFMLLMFLAKKQYNFVYRLFEENKYNLKDKYKPVYYALLSLMGDEYRDEFLKMGPELKETVDEVIAEIKRLEVDYA